MEKLITIRTLKELQELREYIKDKEYIAIDTETTGVSKDSVVIGFSLCADIELAYYVILHAYSKQDDKLIALETTKEAKLILQDLIGKSLIMHNAVFDCYMIKNNFNIELMPSVHTDTMILSHLLNENRSNGLKERGIELYGIDAKKEQEEMKASIAANGGQLTKANYELYKADSDLIAKYGAKDTILTLKLFHNDVPILFEEGLDKFFYEDESMPLLRGPTYDLNTTGLKIDTEGFIALKAQIEADCLESKAFIDKEILGYVKDKYPAVSKAKNPKDVFNINSNQQLSWLLFVKLEQEFTTLNEQGKEVCKALGMKLPYSPAAKRHFIGTINSHQQQVWRPACTDKITGKVTKAKLVQEPEKYITCGVDVLTKLSKKYKWVEKFMFYKKQQKLLNTYVEAILERAQYGVIRPSFMQIGTTSGRYSSKMPNFQNLPRDDKRVKSCIVARPGKVFIGSDYSQLEPRVFASFSGDERLLACFENGDDFYSVIGASVFGVKGCSLKKDDKDSFAKKYPEYRQISKAISLSATYGTTAGKMAQVLNKSQDEAQGIIDDYFESFPSVKQLMLKAHNDAKANGRVTNLFGRPRRMPDALMIGRLFGKTAHADLPYEYRNVLNLAINHTIQSTGASIMNRAAIAFHTNCKLLSQYDPKWKEVRIIMQVHDEIIAEGPEELRTQMIEVLKDAMENTVILPGVKLIADPVAGKRISDLK